MDMEPQYRLCLSSIETCLRRVQSEFPRINAQLTDFRQPLTDEVVANMMAGYAHVNSLLAERTDLFALGNSARILELNERVLYGEDVPHLGELSEHLEVNRQYFYDDQRGGIRDLLEWYELKRKLPVWERAAGAYVRILSQPQLYIEGNHRTGALIMSYILTREGLPPFVLTVDNAKVYFDPSTLVKKTRKRSFAMLYSISGVRRQFARMLQDQADPRFLLPPAQPLGAT